MWIVKWGGSKLILEPCINVYKNKNVRPWYNLKLICSLNFSHPQKNTCASFVLWTILHTGTIFNSSVEKERKKSYHIKRYLVRFDYCDLYSLMFLYLFAYLKSSWWYTCKYKSSKIIYIIIIWVFFVSLLSFIKSKQHPVALRTRDREDQCKKYNENNSIHSPVLHNTHITSFFYNSQVNR